MSSSKRANVLWLAATLAVIFVLALGLTGLELQPGQRVYLTWLAPADSQAVALDGLGIPLIILVRGLLAVMVVLLPVAMVYLLFSAKGRRQLVGLILNVLLLALALQFLQSQMQAQPLGPEPTPTAVEASDALPLSNGAATSAQPPPSPPGWVTGLASVLVAVGVTAAAWGAYVFFKNMTGTRRPMLQQLAAEAQYALAQIEVGGDLRETIVRCYGEMMRAVRQTRGIERQTAITPREFERILEQHGLPAEPVQQLTRLFEAARYSRLVFQPRQAHMARGCLRAIVTACLAAPEAKR